MAITPSRHRPDAPDFSMLVLLTTTIYIDLQSTSTVSPFSLIHHGPAENTATKDQPFRKDAQIATAPRFARAIAIAYTTRALATARAVRAATGCSTSGV